MTLLESEIRGIDKYWRAANYLSVGQIYLLDNPLLRDPLSPEHVKKRLLGHFGTSPGQNFVYTHLAHFIKKHDLDMIYLSGPGHGGPSLVANAYLEGTYSEVYPDISQDEEGMKRLFKQFSFPGGIPSHVAPETPGSIHEGGELGYSLAHAFGAVFDNPGLIASCVIGDGEAETGPLAGAWHSNKFLNPKKDGLVLPILHLNGYKIANPTILARMSREQLVSLFQGYGWKPYFMRYSAEEYDDSDHGCLHRRMQAVLSCIKGDYNFYKSDGYLPEGFPMIILETPKGWTGPKEVDGQKTEGFWRSHQVPLSEVHSNPAHLAILETWLKSYHPEELFNDDGAPNQEVRAATMYGWGNRRMSANPHTNGGLLTRELRLPDIKAYDPHWIRGGIAKGDTRILGLYLRDVIDLNRKNFRIFGPDETASNGLGAVFEATERQFSGKILEYDTNLSNEGRVIDSCLSEHNCQGWLEGYNLTGRHGLFNCYEAFIQIIDSMFNQHAKWMEITKGIPWRADIPSFNYLLSSHWLRQDHNGLTHQDPGFLDIVMNKSPRICRIYLPPDANCLISVFDHCLRSKHKINVVVAGKHPSPQWLGMEDAIRHCKAGIGVWDWASRGIEPDVVLACAGDVPTLEILAATTIFKEYLPDVNFRVVNVVDLTRLQNPGEHPHALSDKDFDEIFTKDKPVVFNFHGYPKLIHQLTYRRTNHSRIHVRGYKNNGGITTPFDTCVRNDMDRFHLVMDSIDRIPSLGYRGEHVKRQLQAKLDDNYAYIRENGVDMPEIADWRWRP